MLMVADAVLKKWEFRAGLGSFSCRGRKMEQMRKAETNAKKKLRSGELNPGRPRAAH